ncbi:putative secreted lipase [Acrodontium crateriforme]|uniref:Secreted lipase n=1 Tax=Acrodontium crateriforme TaxID=150365 RepID=A0AAQ3RA91_9PEZI|nr:putative secreted lipase [Acrodontium crateriforme]
MLLSPLLSILGLPSGNQSPPSSRPAVTIPNGTVIGSTFGNVDSFLGIPYAQPPVGDLRLRRPLPLQNRFGTLHATTVPRSCPQFVTAVNTSSFGQQVSDAIGATKFFADVGNQGEDCLTLNIQRPSAGKILPSQKLPVLFWIYGGGFEFGSTSMYDASSIIQRSIDLDQPIIYVSINYRVNAFGFLPGADLASEGATNLGLRDQRLAMQWVAENIEAWGGDPDKVTIWGESAGSMSVFDHLIINGGDHTYKGRPLFRAAIMDSGSLVGTHNVSSPPAQHIYDTVLSNAGCSGPTSEARLACLRTKDYPTLLNAARSVPALISPKSLALSYPPRQDLWDDFYAIDPDVALNEGRFANVPVIMGNQEDEGTVFALPLTQLRTNDDMISFFSSFFPAIPSSKLEPSADITALLATYPDQPLLGQPDGSPFRTGGLNNVYPQFKRAAALVGDVMLTLSRRYVLERLCSTDGHINTAASETSHTIVSGSSIVHDQTKNLPAISPAHKLRLNPPPHTSNNSSLGERNLNKNLRSPSGSTESNTHIPTVSPLDQVPPTCWSYLSTYKHGKPILGTFHATDLPVAYGQNTDLLIPQCAVQTYYIAFVNDLDPNGRSVDEELHAVGGDVGAASEDVSPTLGSSLGLRPSSGKPVTGGGGGGLNGVLDPNKKPLPVWPPYAISAPQLANFEATQVSFMNDDFRAGSYAVYERAVARFRL